MKSISRSSSLKPNLDTTKQFKVALKIRRREEGGEKKKIRRRLEEENTFILVTFITCDRMKETNIL